MLSLASQSDQKTGRSVKRKLSTLQISTGAFRDQTLCVLVSISFGIEAILFVSILPPTSLRRFVPHEYAARTLERFQCATCHLGDNKLPEIALAGEKFHSDWLQSLFNGEALKVRPWLHARMPGFPGHSKVLATGLAYRAGMDLSKSELEPKPKLVEVGKTIIGAAGYACTNCPAMGETPALQAFEGQGPNLEIAAHRL